MGNLSFIDKAKAWLMDHWPCSLLGHRFSYEPLPGDEPPFEFSICAVCGEVNPKMMEGGGG
jgi:hypothetical protein